MANLAELEQRSFDGVTGESDASKSAASTLHREAYDPFAKQPEKQVSNGAVSGADMKTVSVDEFLSYTKKAFALMDVNGDKKLAVHEVKHAAKNAGLLKDESLSSVEQLMSKHFGTLAAMSKGQLGERYITEDGLNNVSALLNSEKKPGFSAVDDTWMKFKLGTGIGVIAALPAAFGGNYLAGALGVGLAGRIGTIAGAAAIPIVVGAGALVAYSQYKGRQDFAQNGKPAMRSFLNDLAGTERVRQQLG